MKSFSQKTKEGLCKAPFGKTCCIEAELMGFLVFAGRLKKLAVRVSSESREIMKRFAVLMKRTCGEPTLVEELGNNFFCVVSNPKIIDMILKYETGESGLCELFAKEPCCKSAFLRGAFLGGGTLVDPNKNYNMEFNTNSQRIHDDLKQVLGELDLDFRSAKRKGGLVLYSKNSETVCDALTYMGAVSAQMEILNLKIEREWRNDLNRIANGETANIDKVYTAATRQLTAIDTIDKRIGISSLPDDLQEVAYARLKYRDLSLDALGKKLNPPLSKSGVNHRMKRIIEIAEKNK